MKIRLIFEDDTKKIIHFNEEFEKFKDDLFEQELRKFCKEQYAKQLKNYIILKGK